jgi:hypothetical protein
MIDNVMMTCKVKQMSSFGLRSHNKLKMNKYYTVGTFLKFNKKSKYGEKKKDRKRGKIDIPLTYK